MTPTDEAAQSEVTAARAAAGLCDATEMQRTMTQAQADIAQSAHEIVRSLPEAITDDAERLAYLDAFDYDSLPQQENWVSNSDTVKRWPFSHAACELRSQAIAKRDADFSLLNDAALAGIADQGDDFDEYMRALCGDRPDGIIEQYSAATEGHW